MPEFSIIIPVYNRPNEIRELLHTLVEQTYKDFEVLVIEDGSQHTSEAIVEGFGSKLDVRYFYKENEGQGFTRNYGYERAKGRYMIVFDSDCLIPHDYLVQVKDFLSKNEVDAFGGPDAAHDTFTVTQKAISHVMTSFFTTGGIRGRKKHIGQFHPRSFNMGISREVFEKTGGYIIPFMGEDLEFSTRIIKSGFKTALIPEAFVFHKRRTNLAGFYRQLKYFGRARINLTRFHRDQLKLIHLFPLFFNLGLLVSVILAIRGMVLGQLGVSMYGLYFSLICLEALMQSASLKVALLSPIVAFIQLFGYAYGLVYEGIRKVRGINPNTKYIELYD